MQFNDLINAVRSFTQPTELRKYYSLEIIESAIQELGILSKIRRWNHFFQIYDELSSEKQEELMKILPQKKIPIEESLMNQFLMMNHQKGIEIIENIRKYYPEIPVLFPTKLKGCKRELFLQYHSRFRQLQLPSLEQMSFFSIPKYIHEGIQHRIKQIFQSHVEIEKLIEKKYGKYIIQGRLDCFFPGENIVLEIKTFTPHPYRTPQPKISDIEQLMLYLDICESDIGYILTVNRKTGIMKVFDYTIDKEMIQQLHEQCDKIVDEILQPNVIPENISGFGWKTGMCKLCSFSIDNEGFCHKDFKVMDIKIPK